MRALGHFGAPAVKHVEATMDAIGDWLARHERVYDESETHRIFAALAHFNVPSWTDDELIALQDKHLGFHGTQITAMIRDVLADKKP